MESFVSRPFFSISFYLHWFLFPPSKLNTNQSIKLIVYTAHKSSFSFRGLLFCSHVHNISVSVCLNIFAFMSVCVCSVCVTFLLLLWISESLKILSFTTHSSAHILRSYYICQRLAKIARRRASFFFLKKKNIKIKTLNRRFNRSFSSHLQCNRGLPLGKMSNFPCRTCIIKTQNECVNKREKKRCKLFVTTKPHQ